MFPCALGKNRQAFHAAAFHAEQRQVIMSDGNQPSEQAERDRQAVENANQRTYEQYTKLLITIVGGTFLGSSITNIPQRACFTILLISWGFMAITLILILVEMYYSMKESGRYADELYNFKSGDTPEPTLPDNKTIDNLILASLITLILGIIFLLLSLAIPHLSPCQNLP